MVTTVRFPATISVYEAIRTRPGTRSRFESLGLGAEYLDYRITDAARALGLPIERLTEILSPSEGAPRK